MFFDTETIGSQRLGAEETGRNSISADVEGAVPADQDADGLRHPLAIAEEVVSVRTRKQLGALKVDVLERLVEALLKDRDGVRLRQRRGREADGEGDVLGMAGRTRQVAEPRESEHWQPLGDS